MPEVPERSIYVRFLDALHKAPTTLLSFQSFPMHRFLTPQRRFLFQRVGKPTQVPRKAFATMNGAAETDTQAAAAANTSGITPASLSATLKEKLEASHVDINDMSGRVFNSTCSDVGKLTLWHRRMRPSLRGHDRVTAVLKEDYARAASLGEFGAQGRDSGHTCLDTQVSDSGRVGEAPGWSGRWKCMRVSYRVRERFWHWDGVRISVRRH